MEHYKLTSKATEQFDVDKDTQPVRLYRAIEELGGLDAPVSLDKIVEKCAYRRYAGLFKTETSIRNSVKFHLKNWLDEQYVELS